MDPRTFLTALWGNSPPGPILIWMLPQKRSQWYHSFDHINEDLAAYPDRDIYTGVGFPAPGTNELTKTRRGQASDIGGLAGMWADIDIAHVLHKKQNLTPSTEHALEIIAPLPEPTTIIHSGHGLQAWWLFEEPWIFEDQEVNTRARTITQWWHQEIHGLFKAQGMTVDSVQNLDRILRVPGTTNNKDSKNPVPVTVYKEGGPKYRPLDFSQMVPHDFQPRIPVSRNRKTNQIDANGLVLAHDAEPPAIKLMEAERAGPKVPCHLDAKPARLQRPVAISLRHVPGNNRRPGRMDRPGNSQPTDSGETAAGTGPEAPGDLLRNHHHKGPRANRESVGPRTTQRRPIREKHRPPGSVEKHPQHPLRRRNSQDPQIRGRPSNISDVHRPRRHHRRTGRQPGQSKELPGTGRRGDRSAHIKVLISRLGETRPGPAGSLRIRGRWRLIPPGPGDQGMDNRLPGRPDHNPGRQPVPRSPGSRSSKTGTYTSISRTSANG